jgi:phosphatidylserine decarboxylase
MIRFGSRLEVLVPVEGTKLLVNIGHRVRAGETPLFWSPWREKDG